MTANSKFLAAFCYASLALGVGLMVRYTLCNPHTYGASDTVIGKWKQW